MNEDEDFMTEGLDALTGGSGRYFNKNPRVPSSERAPSRSSTNAVLKEREDIARAAYKTWLRIRPGHKVIKDQWWALYYKKIRPEYHCRDNHLGRKIHLWIEEDLAKLRYPGNSQENKSPKPQVRQQLQPPQLSLGHQLIGEEIGDGSVDPVVVDNIESAQLLEGSGVDGTVDSSQQLDKAEEGSSMKSSFGVVKKRKAMSAKEGIHPAYLNVELVHPPKYDLNNLDQLPSHVVTVLQHSRNNDINWTLDSLEEDVQWFREKRKKIMDDIPLISGRQKTISQDRGFKRKYEPDEEAQVYSNVDWIHADLLKSHEAYIFKLDLPGMLPGQDFTVQTDDMSRIIVRGDRKQDIERGVPINTSDELLQRSFGPFEVELIIPFNVDLKRTEQTFRNGVLTVKCPFAWNQTAAHSAELSSVFQT